MMVEDGTLKPAPSDDELHPASVPEAGATATLSSTDQPSTVTGRRPAGSSGAEPPPAPASDGATAVGSATGGSTGGAP